MEMILEIKNFTQKYNDKVAVDNLSLSVEKRRNIWFYRTQWSR